jgi:hypothetical protein
LPAERSQNKQMPRKGKDKLLVINRKPMFYVKTAEDVIACIRKYASDNKLDTFTVSEGEGTLKDNNGKWEDNPKMFLTIKKHNKAG